MQRDDDVYAGHMLDMATKALAIAGGRSREAFDANEVLGLALLHLIQHVGEAASRTTPAYRAMHPEVAWEKIVGMRHRLVHDYLEVDWDVVWEVLTVHLSELVKKLESFVPSVDPDPDSPSTDPP
jgi:uncharacterized protein with HEPN domain